MKVNSAWLKRHKAKESRIKCQEKTQIVKPCQICSERKNRKCK